MNGQLIQLARFVLHTLDINEEWDSGIIDEISDKARALGLAKLGDHGYFAAADLDKAEPDTITIRVEGGVVQDVEDVPAGVIVRVVDYDNDDTTDDCGNPCSIALHDGGAA